MMLDQMREATPGRDLVRAWIDGAGFCGTFKSERDARRMANARNLQVRPFGVRLDAIDPVSKAARKWEQVRGWSTWLVP